jgi:uncharacterized protein YbjT (DUF2867 family)
MKCLVTGAYGFIGSEVVAALARRGVEVVGAGRDLALGRRILPSIDWIPCDFNKDVEVAQWLPRLAGIDAVVNCVGVLQGTARDDADRIHAQATSALFKACAAAGIKRIVHVSAVSAEADMTSLYAQSKAKADAALARLEANWVIVKPSLVIGRGSHGGTSLMRGLAGLPFVLPLPGAAQERFQPIALDDLADGITALIMKDTPSRVTIHAAGPETTSVRDILVAYRAWLGFPPAREINVPLPLLRVMLRVGDAAGWLGHTQAARTTSLTQLHYDTLVDAAEFTRATGVRVKSLTEMLRAWPSTLQDRLHARSFFAVPFLHVTLALFWIFTGAFSLLPASFASAMATITNAGFSGGLARALVAGGALADIVVGVLFLVPGWVRRAGVAMLALSAVYLAGLSAIAPELWTENFGPLLKVVPMMAAILVVMAHEEKR